MVRHLAANLAETSGYAYAFWLVVTAICSVSASAWIAGQRHQKTRNDIENLQKDLAGKADNTKYETVITQLAEIRGMFTLKLKGPEDNG